MSNYGPDPHDKRSKQLHLFGRSEDSNEMDAASPKSPDESLGLPADETKNQETLISLLAYSSLKGIGFKTIQQAFDSGFLVDIWKSPDNAYRHPFLEGKDHPGLLDLAKSSPSRLKAMTEYRLASLQRDGISFIVIDHPDYPQALKKLKDPPRWLFVKGSKQALNLPSIVGVIGTRDPSHEGEILAYKISSCLAKHNIVVLSGLARGIDEAAHRGCLDHFGQTIGILGHGINFSRLSNAADVLSHQIVQRDGAIVSEYLPDDPPSQRSFLRRNELQAALSRVIIPVECPSAQSGTAATVRRAKSINVPVVGFVEHGSEKALETTRQTLASLGAPVYEVADYSLEETLAEILAGFMPDHQWSQGSSARQDRFFDLLTRYVLEHRHRVDLDASSVDRFAKMLKLHLEKDANK